MKLQGLCAILLGTLLFGCAKEKNPTNRSFDSRKVAARGSVRLPKLRYRPGEQIDAILDCEGLHKTAWIGVLPAEIEHGSEVINDTHDLGHAPINGEPPVLAAPAFVGSYEVRLNDSDFDGKELDYAAFEVVDEPVLKTGFSLEKRVFYPEEDINFTFTVSLSDVRADAWIGLIPSGIPRGYERLNDMHHHSRLPLTGRSIGSSTVPAPIYPGKYDLRLNESDDGGRELAHITLEVISKPSPETSPNP